MRYASDYLDEDINRAVISVPAYFDDVQRQAIVEAGKRAGLTVAWIINEPTVAALSNGSEFEVLKEDYAQYYEQIRDFIQTLESTNDIRHVREWLQYEYGRREKYISGEYYYECYPHRRRRQSMTHWDSDEEGTYVRSQPKIGRNDPCPCGSGKKYKNCCGKNK